MKDYCPFRGQARQRKGSVPLLVLALAAAISFPSCKERVENVAEVSAAFSAMGTIISISAYAASAEEAEAAASLAQAEIIRLEKLWSATDPESEIFALNSAADSVNVSEETADLLRFSKEMAQLTSSSFDPTVYPIVDAWGFSTHQYRIPDEEEIAALLLLAGSEKIILEGAKVTLLGGAQVDLGGIAKGAGGDAAASIMREAGAASAIINLGGNVQLVGARPDGNPWRIGIRKPYGNGILGVLGAQDCAVVTSGGYERNFEGEDGRVYHHIIDPATGYPAESGLASSTIIAGEGKLADALSTGLFVMGAERAADFWREHGGSFEIILLTSENEILVSEGIAGSFSPQPEYADTARVITKDAAYSPLLSEFAAAGAAR